MLRNAHAIGAAGEGADLQTLLQTCNADFEELIEIGAGDTKEANPLEQRQGFVVRLSENATVEVQKR